jgi:hypothetical protein
MLNVRLHFPLSLSAFSLQPLAFSLGYLVRIFAAFALQRTQRKPLIANKDGGFPLPEARAKNVQKSLKKLLTKPSIFEKVTLHTAT